MRYRKNINCLSTNELHDLREAFTAIYALPETNPNSFARIAGLHGLPLPYYCIHVNTGFLTWHRAYLLAIEDALRTVHCDIALPYWNWSSYNTVGVPVACKNATYVDRNSNTISNPLYRGPIAPSVGGGMTNRGANINTTSFAAHRNAAQSALSQTSWSSFVPQLNSVHGSVHGAIGGSMGGAATAGYDPIFHFHHCNIDRLWANWQNNNPMPLPSSEANVILDPFTRPFTNTWHVGADFANILDWDYKYRNWCFTVPSWNWPQKAFIKIPIADWVFESDQIILKISSSMMPKNSVSFRVFINEEKIDLKTKTEENPKYAGNISFFGMGDAGMNQNLQEPFSMALSITETLRKLTKKNNKHFAISLVPVYPENTKIYKNDITQFEVSLDVE